MIKKFSVVIALLIIGSSFFITYRSGYKTANQEWVNKWERRDRADLAAKNKRERDERTEEQRRQKSIDAERERADRELAQVKSDADRAAVSGERLQLTITTLKRQLAGSETGRLSAVAATSAAKGQVAILLAELLSESDKAAGEYAAEADRYHAAGESCERTYNAVTQHSGQ